jgi:hypothetical protein
LEDLSYRQLLLLSLFAEPGLLKRDRGFLGEGTTDPNRYVLPTPLLAVLTETYDLYNRGLVSNGGSQSMGRRLLMLAGPTSGEGGEGIDELIQIWESVPPTAWGEAPAS